jgi:hypothetical protein
MTSSGYSIGFAAGTLASLTMHNIERVIDIQRDRTRWALVAGAVGVDHGIGHAYDFAQSGGILPARHGWLRAKIGAAVRQTSAGQFEARIGDQRRQPVGDVEFLFDSREQHHAAIGGDSSTIERGSDFLALNGWGTEWQQVIFEHGRCGSVRFGGNWLRYQNLCFRSDAYATSASESLPCAE